MNISWDMYSCVHGRLDKERDIGSSDSDVHLMARSIILHASTRTFPYPKLATEDHL